MFKLPNAGKKPTPKWKKLAPKKIGIEEPIRKTMYDIVIENLKLANRKTFLHRLIYIGYHSFGKEEDLAIQFFSKTVSTINNLGGIEAITGFYLHYTKHFVHVVESDEDSVNRHLKLLLSSEEAKKLSNIKILVDLCHISDRLTPYWSSYSGIPKKLVNPPTHSDNETLDDYSRQVFNCVVKIYQLLIKIYEHESSITENSKRDNLSIGEHSISVGASTSIPRFSAIRMNSVSTMSSFLSPRICPFINVLPEYEVLDYIITSPHVMDLKEYCGLWGLMTEREIYKDKVWPAPADFVPYDVYEVEYDRAIHMPRRDREETKSKRTESGDVEDEDEENEEDVEKE